MGGGEWAMAVVPHLRASTRGPEELKQRQRQKARAGLLKVVLITLMSGAIVFLLDLCTKRNS